MWSTKRQLVFNTSFEVTLSVRIETGDTFTGQWHNAHCILNWDFRPCMRNDMKCSNVGCKIVHDQYTLESYETSQVGDEGLVAQWFSKLTQSKSSSQKAILLEWWCIGVTRLVTRLEIGRVLQLDNSESVKLNSKKWCLRESWRGRSFLSMVTLTICG